MPEEQVDRWARREFLRATALASGSTLLGLRLHALGAEAPPEPTRLRVAQILNNCHAPQYMAEDLLRGEGFCELQ